MSTCLTALLMFLGSHQLDDAKLGWVLGDQETWAFTWLEYTSAKQNYVHYFAFNHIPSDSKVPVKKTSSCKLPNGKIVPVLELLAERK